MQKIAIILIFLSSLALADNIFIKKNGKEKRLRSIEMNGSDYVYSYDVARNIFPNSKYDSKTNTISNPAFTLKFHPGNFYLMMEDWEGRRIIQLGLPVAEYRNKIYFPASHFFFGLDSLDIFSISQSKDQKLFTVVQTGETLLKPLEKYKPRSKQENKTAVVYDREGNPVLINLNSTENPFSETFLENSAALSEFLELMDNFEESYIPIKDYEKEKIDQNPEEFRPSKKTKPTPYFLPEELIREELEEVRRGER